jgi:Na+-transporting NADH:ubiquinone oxidoreductase subunit A
MKCIDIKRGLNISPDSAFMTLVDAAPARSVALLGIDYPGMKPVLAVKQGDHVRLGDVLFTDRTEQEIRCCAPATGLVSAIHLGARRSLQALVIELTDDTDACSITHIGRGNDADKVRNALQLNGMWPTLRVRPYDVIPAVDADADVLFITAIDTHPLALDPLQIIARNAEAFAAGVGHLSLMAGHTFVCTAPATTLTYPDLPRVSTVTFRGPHPAGLAGTHIHHLAPAATQAWYIGYQDVIAIGHLFLHGKSSVQREISLAGPGLAQPLHLRTRIGAALADLTSGLTSDLTPGSYATSGSPLSQQRDALIGSYLGRQHNQAWVRAPLTPNSAIPAKVKSWLQQLVAPRCAIDMRHQGEVAVTGMLSVEAFDSVWPFNLPVGPLLRSILTEDTATANELGATMLAEEDLALCSYVCPAKQDYGAALRATLQAFEKED